MSTNKKRSNNCKPRTSRASVVVKDVHIGGRRKTKKWSKDKTRQKLEELDGEVDALYASNTILPLVQPTFYDHLEQLGVQTLEETLYRL